MGRIQLFKRGSFKGLPTKMYRETALFMLCVWRGVLARTLGVELLFAVLTTIIADKADNYQITKGDQYKRGQDNGNVIHKIFACYGITPLSSGKLCHDRICRSSVPFVQRIVPEY